MSKSSKVVLNVLITAVLLVTLDAYDEECATELQVRRNTVYGPFAGQQLRIDCPVVFCNNSPPTINWYKIEDKRVHLNNDNNHIITGWETSGLSKGIFYLIFKNIVSSDSGIYRCEGGGTVSHNIKITVYGNTEPTTSSQPWKSSTTERAVTQGIFWPCMYRVITIGAFFLIVIFTCIISKAVLGGPCRKTAEPCPESSDEIYDDVQV